MFKIEGTESQGFSYCDKCKLVNNVIDLNDNSIYYNDYNSSELIEKIKIDNKDNIIQYLSQYNIYIGIYYGN